MASSSSPSLTTMADPPNGNFYPKDEDASLHQVHFTSKCPPDVSPNTRIVAVCGITDIADAASPTMDGWLLSDFWMFNHLFRSAPVAKQTWFTCCSPKDLVDRYERYAHGSALQEPRIVLEERLLDTISAAGTLRVVESKTILERFLKTVEEECKEAVKANQKILLLIFGLGDINSYGMTMGSGSNTEFSEKSAPQLKRKDLEAAVGKETRCTILKTPRFDDGWTIQPDLNLTLIAAKEHQAKGHWNPSLTPGFPSSFITSAICDTIFATEIEDATETEDEENIEEPETEFDKWDRINDYRTEMSYIIRYHFRQNVRFHSEHQISFRAEDDEWTRVWDERSGIPLAFFKERWEELSILPAQADDGSSFADLSSDLSALGLSDTDPDSTSRIPLKKLKLTMTAPQMRAVVRGMAVGYARSFPGQDEQASNTAFHAMIRLWLLSGKESSQNLLRKDSLLTWGYTLNYRLGAMDMATRYKDFLGLDFPDCTSFCITGWTHPLYESKEPDAKEKIMRYSQIHGMVHSAKIFGCATDGYWYHYAKPEEYLAIVFFECYNTNAEIEQAINRLENCKSCRFSFPSALNLPTTTTNYENSPYRKSTS
jgi:hypothetical protein